MPVVSSGHRVQPANKRGLTPTFVAVVLSLTVSSCSSGSSTTPTPIQMAPSDSISGVWVGTVTHSSAGHGSFRLSIADRPSLLGDRAGNWEMVFGDATESRRGTASISADADGDVHGFLLSAAGTRSECSFQSVVTLMMKAAGNRLTGTIVFGHCGTPITGDASLSKQ